MDAVEFAPIAAAMLSRWYAFPIPPSALDQYVEDLGDLDADVVKAAVEALGAVDRLERPPTSGQIRRRVAEMHLDPPTWDQVRTALVRWREEQEHRQQLAKSWRCPEDRCDGSGFVIDTEQNLAPKCGCYDARSRVVRGLDRLPVLVAEFVAERHVAAPDVDRMLAGETTVESQVRGRWREFVGRAVEARVLSQLRSQVDLPQIAAARQETEERSGEPRRLNAAAFLPSGPRPTPTLVGVEERDAARTS